MCIIPLLPLMVPKIRSSEQYNAPDYNAHMSQGGLVERAAVQLMLMTSVSMTGPPLPTETTVLHWQWHKHAVVCYLQAHPHYGAPVLLFCCCCRLHPDSASTAVLWRPCMRCSLLGAATFLLSVLHPLDGCQPPPLNMCALHIPYRAHHAIVPSCSFNQWMADCRPCGRGRMPCKPYTLKVLCLLDLISCAIVSVTAMIVHGLDAVHCTWHVHYGTLWCRT